MSQQYLRHKPTGIIYAYQETFALRDDFEPYVMPGAEPAPEQEPKPAKKRAKSEVVIVDEAALSADASRGISV